MHTDLETFTLAVIYTHWHKEIYHIYCIQNNPSHTDVCQASDHVESMTSSILFQLSWRLGLEGSIDDNVNHVP